MHWLLFPGSVCIFLLLISLLYISLHSFDNTKCEISRTIVIVNRLLRSPWIMAGHCTVICHHTSYHHISTYHSVQLIIQLSPCAAGTCSTTSAERTSISLFTAGILKNGNTYLSHITIILDIRYLYLKANHVNMCSHITYAKWQQWHDVKKYRTYTYYAAS